MQVAKILLPLAKLFPLDYLVPNEMRLVIGDLVVVPFRNKELTGIIWDLSDKIPEKLDKIKFIKQKVPLDFSINQQMIDLIRWVATYYLSELGSVAKLVLPVDVGEKPIKIKHQEILSNFTLPPLSLDQQNALTLLKEMPIPPAFLEI
jgi:primosomal protein N' (replication factor Y)